MRVKNNLVQSVERSFDIIELLGRSSGSVGVTEVARDLGLKTPTTHNLLRTLTARGYVSRDKNQRYRLGFGCGQLGQAYHFALRIPGVSRPAIEKLAGSLDESVVVAMMERGEIDIIDNLKLLRSLKSMTFEYTSEANLKIYGSYSHLSEAFVRACWATKAKHLNIFVY